MWYFQSNSFPERGLIYDYCFEKKSSGQWTDWMDTLDKSLQAIAPTAKVSKILFHLFPNAPILPKVLDLVIQTNMVHCVLRFGGFDSLSVIIAGKWPDYKSIITLFDCFVCDFCRWVTWFSKPIQYSVYWGVKDFDHLCIEGSLQFCMQLLQMSNLISEPIQYSVNWGVGDFYCLFTEEFDCVYSRIWLCVLKDLTVCTEGFDYVFWRILTVLCVIITGEWPDHPDQWDSSPDLLPADLSASWGTSPLCGTHRDRQVSHHQ